ncbi:hypothetical protein GCM10020295_45330 [Streptomyces cinereospinus]
MGQTGHLVLAVLVHRDADGQVLGAGHVLDGLRELVHRAQAGPGHRETGGARAHHADAGDQQEEQGELLEGVLRVVQRQRDEQGDAVGQGGTAMVRTGLPLVSLALLKCRGPSGFLAASTSPPSTGTEPAELPKTQ